MGITQPTGLLVLVRHGQSTDNVRNLFSGWRDPDLTDRGIKEARDAGRRLKILGHRFDAGYTSRLSRTHRTLALILEEIDQLDLPSTSNEALDERHYGELSGLNKEDARSVWGSDQVHLWRKSYHAVPPGGESLEMTAARTMPFLRRELTPRLQKGEHLLVVAHGNSLRSIVKHLDEVSDEDIADVHIGTSQIIVYEIDASGAVIGKTSVAAKV